MKNASKDLETRLQSVAGKAGAGVVALGASASAFAVDHTAEITAAQGDATTNTTAAVAAVIAVAAVVFGVGIVLRLLNR